MAETLKNPHDDKPFSPAWWRWEWADVSRRQEEMKLRWFRRVLWVAALFKRKKKK